MTVGCLGDIIFQVDESVIYTIDKFKWSGKATIGIHHRHNNNALTEFGGVEPDNISFGVYLSDDFLLNAGSNVLAEITKVWTYERTGRTLPLTIGNRGYGKFRWLITEHSFLQNNLMVRAM